MHQATSLDNILTKQDIQAIWDTCEDSFQMMKAAAQIGFEKGRISQLRKDNAELNAVLHVVQHQIEKEMTQ